MTDPIVVNPALLPPGAGGSLAPLAGPGAPSRTQAGQATATSGGPSFADLLSANSNATGNAVGVGRPPSFSRHALERLQRRGIDMNAPTLSRLSDGIARAAGKGSRDSVVLVDNTAFVVSVRNNTVITAVDSGHMREHVFTNIDSAVIA